MRDIHALPKLAIGLGTIGAFWLIVLAVSIVEAMHEAETYPQHTGIGGWIAPTYGAGQ